MTESDEFVSMIRTLHLSGFGECVLSICFFVFCFCCLYNHQIYIYLYTCQSYIYQLVSLDTLFFFSTFSTFFFSTFFFF